jgi:hypothetical protein
MFGRGGFDMSEEIKRGDLVVVVRGLRCCGYTKVLGRTFIVRYLIDGLPGRCSQCGETTTEPGACGDDGLFNDIYQLKKIPPLNELEDQTEERKVEV